MMDTRQNIINSAKQLLYASSYCNVGVQTICDRANVKKGSFYHFFLSKRALTIAVIDDLLHDYEQMVLSLAFEDDLPPLQRFQRFVEKLHQLQLSVKQEQGKTLGCPFGNLALEMGSQDEELRQHLNQAFTRVENYFEQNLKDAIQQGDIDPSVDTKASASAMFAYVEGMMVLAKTRDDPELIRTLGTILSTLCINT